MSSGFNHLTLTIGDNFAPGVPYDVTDQVITDIFDNNKMLYCTIYFPESFHNILGFKKVVGVMSLLDNKTYAKSDIMPTTNAGIAIVGTNLVKELDRTYLLINYDFIGG